MAHRLLGRGLLGVPKKIEIRQQYDYLLMLDFEATCEKNTILDPQEIIEFPCVALSTEDWHVKSIFHQYVKPRIHPTLSPFCTELTGIMQENVDGQPHFSMILAEFEKWLAAGNFLANERTSVFVTCGNWDLRVMLPNQCALDGLKVPKYFQRWIDLKTTYCEVTNYYPRSLKDMLIRSNIPLRGKLHSGLCDAKNMAEISTDLWRNYNGIFKITSTPKIKMKDHFEKKSERNPVIM